MVGRIFKSKKLIVGILVLLVIIVSCLVAFVVWSKDSKPTDSSTAANEGKKESSKTAQAPDKVEQFTAPEAKLPDMCSKASDTVKQVIGDDLKSSGNSGKTNSNSKFTECIFSKGNQLANVKIYEYSSESDAKADLSKVQPKGFSGQTKGKYNIVVSVVTATENTAGNNTAAADKIVQGVAAKL